LAEAPLGRCFTTARFVTDMYPRPSEQVDEGIRERAALRHGRGMHMDDRWRIVIAAAVVLALPVGGCRDGRRWEPWPVGTCVRESDDGGSAVVSCAEPHTHKVTAIVAGDGDACPGNTVMYSTPADPDDGVMTTCFQAHRILEDPQR
jgi:hypothetical protein